MLLLVHPLFLMVASTTPLSRQPLPTSGAPPSALTVHVMWPPYNNKAMLSSPRSQPQPHSWFSLVEWWVNTVSCRVEKLIAIQERMLMKCDIIVFISTYSLSRLIIITATFITGCLLLEWPFTYLHGFQARLYCSLVSIHPAWGGTYFFSNHSIHYLFSPLPPRTPLTTAWLLPTSRVWSKKKHFNSNTAIPPPSTRGLWACTPQALCPPDSHTPVLTSTLSKAY